MPETTKKPKAAKKPAEHPTFAVMIAAAIAELKERKGSSRQAIEKYIAANYKVGPKYTGPMKQALKKWELKKFCLLKLTLLFLKARKVR